MAFNGLFSLRFLLNKIDLRFLQRVFCGVFELHLLPRNSEKRNKMYFLYKFCPFVLRFDFLGVRDISVEERVYGRVWCSSYFRGIHAVSIALPLMVTFLYPLAASLAAKR
jgi:hypothetical protein